MNRQPLHILVVEDEPTYQLLCHDVLERSGFNVHACRTGIEAIQLLGTSTFDVVVLDYKMPEASGINVLQWMYGRKMHVPVILLTGYGSEEIEFEAVKWGVSEYLVKTHFDPQLLPDVVTRVHLQAVSHREG